MNQKKILKTALWGVFVLLTVTGSLFAMAVTSGTSRTTEVTEQQAQATASSLVQGEVSEVEVEYENERKVYEVEVRDETGETEVKIDASSGEILSIEDEDEEYVSSAGAKVTAAEAKAIAVQETGGRVTDLDTDRERGRDVWEVEVRTSRGEADVLVDMETGEVLAVEWEDEEDEDDD
jgi:uncharacterized membrane protein YkoI